MRKAPRWRVLVADDEPAARRGVRQLLAAFPDFAVVGECRDGREVLAALDRLKPDVLFLDIQMPEIDGFEVIRRRTPERMPVVVFLTAYDQLRDSRVRRRGARLPGEAGERGPVCRDDRAPRPAPGLGRRPGARRRPRRLSSRPPAARPCSGCARSTGSKRPTTTRGSGPRAGVTCSVNRWTNWNGVFARTVSRAPIVRRSSGSTLSARCGQPRRSSPCSRAARRSRCRAGAARRSRQPCGPATGKPPALVTPQGTRSPPLAILSI